MTSSTRLSTSKMSVTAVQILNNRVFPFLEQHGVKVETVLSDNGREYCGRGTEARTPHRVFKKGIRKLRTRKTSTGKEMKTAARSADLGEAGRQVITILVDFVSFFLVSFISQLLPQLALLMLHHQPYVDCEQYLVRRQATIVPQPSPLPHINDNIINWHCHIP